MKYFCDIINDKIYLRGLCGNDDYSKWRVIKTDFWADNKYMDENNRPCWRCVDGKVIYEPLPKSKAELQAEKEAKEKEDYIKAMPDLVKALQLEVEDLKVTIKELKVKEAVK